VDIGQSARRSPRLSVRGALQLLAESPTGLDPYCEAVIPDSVRSLWEEPRVPDPPVRVWRDWVLVGVILIAAILEGTLRSDVIWRPLAIALTLGLVWTVLWRRTRPLAMVIITFGTVTALSVATIVAGVSSVGLNTTVFVLLMAYSLVRWGSGRDIVLGLPLILFAYALGIVADYTTVGEAAAGAVFAIFPVVLGGLVRYRVNYGVNERERIKLSERTQLARELHDTVAHHVSAIAVRAQAGRVVAATNPRAAVESLQIIEEEASRALTEMRLMVGSLRDGEEADFAPQRGVADIPRLAHGAGDSPRVTVELSGALDDLGPAIGAAVYRLAQESITNALRHARHATRVDVHVTGSDHYVHLTVADDGDAHAVAPSWSGFGLVGMRERAALLGGTLDAGPSPNKGWVVNAVLPKGSAT